MVLKRVDWIKLSLLTESVGAIPPGPCLKRCHWIYSQANARRRDEGMLPQPVPQALDGLVPASTPFLRIHDNHYINKLVFRSSTKSLEGGGNVSWLNSRTRMAVFIPAKQLDSSLGN